MDKISFFSVPVKGLRTLLSFRAEVSYQGFDLFLSYNSDMWAMNVFVDKFALFLMRFKWLPKMMCSRAEVSYQGFDLFL